MALTFEKRGENDKAQECRNEKFKCIQTKDNFINTANEREKLADKWENLAIDIKDNSLGVLGDIDKLENFLRQGEDGCNENTCPEIRRLIENHLLKEFNRYQQLLDFCRDN
jgi:hypothetical protein